MRAHPVSSRCGQGGDTPGKMDAFPLTRLLMNHAPSLVIQDHIATLTLQRPAAANKITPDDLVSLRRHVDTVNQTEEVLLLVLRSTGKHFCAGYDITQVSGSQTEGQGFGDMVDAIEQCRAVTLAVVQGGVYGGATDMVLACDFRMGSSAVEMFMPAALLGLLTALWQRLRHGLHVAHLALMVLRVPLGLDIDRALYFIALRVLQVIGMQVVAPQGLVIAVTKSNGLGIT